MTYVLCRDGSGALDGLVSLAITTSPHPNYRLRFLGPNVDAVGALPAGLTAVRTQVRTTGARGQACYVTDLTGVVPRSPLKLRARR